MTEKYYVPMYLCRDKEKYVTTNNFLQNQSLEQIWWRHREIMSRPSSFVPLEISVATQIHMSRHTFPVTSNRLVHSLSRRREPVSQQRLISISTKDCLSRQSFGFPHNCTINYFSINTQITVCNIFLPLKSYL